MELGIEKLLSAWKEKAGWPFWPLNAECVNSADLWRQTMAGLQMCTSYKYK